MIVWHPMCSFGWSPEIANILQQSIVNQVLTLSQEESGLRKVIGIHFATVLAVLSSLILEQE